MAPELNEIKVFVEEILDLGDKALAGQQRLALLLNDRPGFMRAIRTGIIMKLQEYRLKKLALMKEELITRSKEENWKSIPGVEEFAGMALSKLSSPIGGINGKFDSR